MPERPARSPHGYRPPAAGFPIRPVSRAGASRCTRRNFFSRGGAEPRRGANWPLRVKQSPRAPEIPEQNDVVLIRRTPGSPGDPPASRGTPETNNLNSPEGRLTRPVASPTGSLFAALRETRLFPNGSPAKPPRQRETGSPEPRRHGRKS